MSLLTTDATDEGVQHTATMKAYLRKTVCQIFRYSPLVEYESKLQKNGSLATLFFKGLNLEAEYKTEKELDNAKEMLWFEQKYRNKVRTCFEWEM